MAARLPLLLFVLANAAVQASLYLVWQTDLLAAAPNADPAVLSAPFAAWVVAAALTAAAAVDAVGALSRLLWPAVVLAEGVLSALVVLDVKTYTMTGVHLYSRVVLDTLQNGAFDRELRLGPRTFLSLGAFALGIAACQWLLLVLSRRIGRRLAGRGRLAAPALALLGLAVSAGAATTLVQRVPEAQASGLDALPGWEPLLAGERYQAAWDTIRYPPTPAAPPLTRRPHIVFAVAESLRADAFTPEQMPELTALAARRGCLVSERHYSGGHTTELGVFSLLYGLNTYHYAPFASTRTHSAPLDRLRQSGYALLGASTSALRTWNEADFLVDQLDSYREDLSEPVHTADLHLIEWATGLPRERPTFMFLFLNSTHHNYSYPAAFERHIPVMPAEYDHFLGDDALRADADRIRNRYRNSVLWVDHLLGRLGRTLPDETVLLITGDHGEEFWEHGLLGHGASRFVEQRIRVPFVLCLPGRAAARPALSSHVDAWATLFDHLGAPPGPTDGISLLAPPPPDRLVVVGGTRFPYDNPRAALIGGDRKVWVELCRTAHFCVRPIRVTDLDDHPATGPGDLLDRLTARIQRFVTLR